MNIFVKFQQKKKKLISFLVFFAFLIIGFSVYKDYNIYGDEPFHRWAGLTYYNFIKTYLTTQNLNNIYFFEIQGFLKDDGYKWWFVYPIFFDLFAELIVDLFNIENQNIYFLRHFLVFLFFFSSTIFFYLLIQKRFNNEFYSLLSASILFLTPCIFSNAFFNSKDIIFLSLSTISFYFAISFLENKQLKNLILFSITSGLLINARIYGLIIIFCFYFFFLFQGKIDIKYLPKKLLLILISFITSCFVCFLFWPFLWFDFLENIRIYFYYITTALENLKITNLYLGKIYQETNLPIHYLPVWILITVPFSLLILSVVGLYKICVNFLNSLDQIDKTDKLYNNNNDLIDYFFFIYLSASFVFYILSNYNHGSWRYFYFIYPLIIYFGIYTLNFIKNFNIKYFYFFAIIIILNLFSNSIWMIKHHPFQNVFLNLIQKKIIKKKFDLDYVGNSDVHMLRYILENSNSKNIKVSSIGYTWIKGSFEILNVQEKTRLNFTDIYTSDYLIFRNSPPYTNEAIETYIKKNYNNDFELIIDSNIINTVYKRKK